MKNLYTVISILAFSFLAQSQSSHYLTTYHGLTSDTVNCIVEDPQSNIWVGTSKGLNKVDALGNVTTIFLLNGYKIFDVDYSVSSGVWAATDKGLVNFYNNQITVYDSTMAYTVSKVSEVEITSNGTVWSLNAKKLYQLQGGQLSKYTYPNLGISPGNENILTMSASGSVLLVKPFFGNNVGYKIKNGFDKFFYNAGGFIKNGLFDYKGLYYCVSGNSILILRNDSLVPFDTVSGFISTAIQGFDKTTGDVFMRSNYDMAIYNLNSKSVKNVDLKWKDYSGGLGDNVVYRNSASMSISLSSTGLLYEFYKNATYISSLQLGKLNYSFNRLRNPNHHAYIDTLGKLCPLSFYDGFNVFGFQQNLNKVSSMVSHGIGPLEWELGPVSNNYSLPVYHKKFAKIFQMTKPVIDNHILNYNSPGYVMPTTIKDWPGNGNSYTGESFSLAPFVDVNNNGLYEPQLGDYPEIPGDECIYAIYHEPQISDTNFGLGIEVHRFAYIFNDGVFEHENTVYHHFSVVNRSGQTIDSLKFSLLSDLDNGNHINDQSAIDTTSHSFFIWNAGKDISFIHGFYPLQAAAGFSSLDHKIEAHQVYWPNDFYEYNYQTRGLHYDGSLNWDSTLQTSSPYQYLWMGDSIFHFTDSYVQKGDHRQMATLEPKSLPAGEKLCYNFAFTYNIINDSVAGINALKQTKVRMDSIRALWQTSNLMSCLMPTLSDGENSPSQKSDLKIYPNPAQDRIVIESFYEIEKVVIYNLQGSLVLEKKFRSPVVELDLKLKSGIYFLRVFSNGKWISERLVIVE